MASINILLNKAATASNYVSPFSANRVNNGNGTDPVSRWMARIDSSPAWVMVDAGASFFVNRWVAKFMGGAGWANLGNYNPTSFSFYSSMDNSTWTLRDSVTSNTSSSVDRTLAVGFTARYFRIVVATGPAINPKLASVVEFEVYTAPVLTALAISSGTLTPPFVQTTTAYTATVPNSTSSITVTPTAGNSTSVITVNGTTVTSGQASAALPLVVGDNTITINVTDGTTKTYTIVVTRQLGAILSGLTAQSGSTNIALLPTPFASTTYAYTASVGFDITSITVTPTAGQANSTITVNGTAVTSGSASGAINLVVGDNTIPVIVTANGVSQTYNIKVTRANSGYLSALTVQSGTTAIALSPTPFVKTTLGYSATVGYDVSSVTVTPTAEGTNASITVNGSPTTSGQASVSIPLTVGTTTIPVVVTAGGITQNYSITITRVDTSLSGLIMMGMPGNSPMTLAPGFQSTITAYTSATSKGKITVTPTTGATGSTIKVNGTTVASGTASAQITLTGKTTVTITVTIGNTTTTYQVVVN